MAAKARGWPVYAETCPHYLTLDRCASTTATDEAEVIKSVISPPLRSEADRQALWLGLRAAAWTWSATDHVPDRVAVEKAVPAPPFPQISNGAPGIETLLSVVYNDGRGRRPDLGRAHGRRAGHDARLACSAWRRRVRWRSGVTPTWCCSIRTRRECIRQADLHHTSDFTPYEGMPVRGAVRTRAAARRAGRP